MKSEIIQNPAPNKEREYPKLRRPIDPKNGTYIVLFVSPCAGSVVYSESRFNTLGLTSGDWMPDLFEDCEKDFAVCLTQL